MLKMNSLQNMYTNCLKNMGIPYYSTLVPVKPAWLSFFLLLDICSKSSRYIKIIISALLFLFFSVCIANRYRLLPWFTHLTGNKCWIWPVLFSDNFLDLVKAHGWSRIWGTYFCVYRMVQKHYFDFLKISSLVVFDIKNCPCQSI